MASKGIYFVLLVVAFSLVIAKTDAGKIEIDNISAIPNSQETDAGTTEIDNISAIPNSQETDAGTTEIDNISAIPNSQETDAQPQSQESQSYPRGSSIPDEDLARLTEALFALQKNTPNEHITLNIRDTTPESGVPYVPFLQVKPGAVKSQTIKKIIKISKNYQLDINEPEILTRDQIAAENELIAEICGTMVMKKALTFISKIESIQKRPTKEILHDLWFELYPRQGTKGKIGSSGFQHVFVAEVDGKAKVSGLHNWIYFYYQEEAKRARYLNSLAKLDLEKKGSVVNINMQFDNIEKSTSMFVGTTPELEMALYTVCFFARPNGKCPVSLGGTKFDIMTGVMTFRGKDMIGTAYPIAEKTM